MSKILKFKKINVLKLSFITAIMYTLLSFCIFLVVAVFGLAIQGQAIGLVLAIVMPIVYGVLGFISGLISGSLYNLVSKWIGGIEVEVEEIEKFSE